MVAECVEINAWNAGCSSVEGFVECDPQVATERFVATVGQTLFQLLSFAYAPGTDSLDVHKNGLLIDPAHIVELTSTAFSIQNETVLAEDIIVASALTGVTASIAINVTNVSSESVVANAGQLIFSFVKSIVGASVYINGPGVDTGRLIETTNYTTDVGNNQITLIDSLPAGARLTIVYNDSAIGGNISSGADILDVTAAVNTTGKFVGKSEVNSTNFHLVIATGALAADTWIDQVDGAVITPV